jgi:hypothetical protein
VLRLFRLHLAPRENFRWADLVQET